WDRPTSGLEVLSTSPTRPVQAPLARARRTNARGVVMAKRYTHSSSRTPELVADYLDHRDEEVMEALVTGRVEAVERDELVNFIDRQRLVPAISQHDIAQAFDSRVRQLEDRDSVQVIVESL